MEDRGLTIPSELGRISVSPAAIAQIVGRVATQCYGVVGMSLRGPARERVTQLLPKGRPARGIVVRNVNGAVALELYVVVAYGLNLAEVAATATAHPSIVQRFSIGKSYQGRDIWAVKISDNVGVDEAEPEVMFDGTHHSDEHMATEMTLHILHWLVDGYGTVPRITNIVNSREIWIVFTVMLVLGVGMSFFFWRKRYLGRRT